MFENNVLRVIFVPNKYSFVVNLDNTINNSDNIPSNYKMIKKEWVGNNGR